MLQVGRSPILSSDEMKDLKNNLKCSSTCPCTVQSTSAHLFFNNINFNNILMTAARMLKYFLFIITILIGRTILLDSTPFPRRFFLDVRFLQSKAVSPVSNPEPEGTGLCINTHPYYRVAHLYPLPLSTISSSSTANRAAVEVF